ncbi:MAG: transglycosylase SLT domain-containing protein [Methylovulum sp.]|uniref:transglycosylase SLT domain-containing protein n=1 Tax=Methylovulum sp. TaxID=1916980 RepID=UPI00260E74B1|nr:transglycosylase SLT domain-containing protein [Methylovulum sp.]MDD2723325.1 transglycosylase SLT domain-containing protein [Methylovulum sp.]
MAIKHFYQLALVAGLFFLTKWLPSQSLDEQRTVFLRAEKLLEQGNDAAFLELGETLADYPLYPYLQYEWLKKHLQKTDKVTEFLTRYAQTRHAPLLRAKWLDYLAKHGRWQEFVDYYQGTENPSRECYYYWALHETGKKEQALHEAKRLWLTGASQPPACDDLLAEFIKSPEFNQDWVWQRFSLAVNQENWPLVEYLRRMLDKPGQKNADFWLQVYKKPYLVKDSGLWMGADAMTGRIFAEGIARLAQIDVDLALLLWDGRKHYLAIDKQTLDKTDNKLAMILFNHQDSRAYRRLQQVSGPDGKVREAKVRAALLEGDWQHVGDALASLPWEQQHEPTWQYWRARVLEMMGNAEEAKKIYLQLADDRSFYGFLAADKLGNGYTISDKPVLIADGKMEALLKQTNFKAIQEWRSLNRDLEARRQWWFAIERLDKQQLRVAAKLAQQWQWDQVAIMTLVKADYWDDLGLRFPLRYVDEVRRNATQQSLDPAIIFGLMRQESLLDSNAVSPVGAKGLMQLMPATAGQIAGKLDETWHTDSQLFNPEVNIRYGSHYFAELLQRFNGHVALAAAAYNAGPNRVAKWLPVNRNMPADIWVETIPFKETRKYVTSVLAYAIIYQQRLQTDALKIKNMLAELRGK